MDKQLHEQRWPKVMLLSALGLLLSFILYNMITQYREDRRIERTKAPPIEHFERAASGEPICPYCGHRDQIRVFLYGLIRDDLPQGTISGGCALGPDSPEYKCLSCGTRFGKSKQYEIWTKPPETEKKQ
jgi:DNA-directed RNA polymerase subunit RPC12/RpoP